MVYYSDGVHEVGSFFGKSYRIYVPLKNIPLYCREAVISAEDRWFYHHPGFNPISMLRALIVDLIKGRIVEGGSTITQQTAKNLFGRRGRTVYEKIKELINALRLEHYYTKDEILEFYLNQFYVKGQGRGIGVAARYFFNKDVSDLTLKECAFIAGSVKAPSMYDIFSAKNIQQEKRIRERIRKRVHYVLYRMYRNGYIDRKTYLHALREKLKFHMGILSTRPNVMINVISDILESPEFQEIWESAGIENIYTAGLKIYTTLDYDLERESLFALRKRLSLLDTLLRGYSPPSGISLEVYPSLEKGFYYGSIVRKGRKALTVRIRAPSPQNIKVNLLECPQVPVADYFYRRGRWVSPTVAVRYFMKNFKKGDPVLISYDGEKFCVEKYPRLEGAVFVTQAGRIKAMVGGFTNIYYNRAWVARRQPGSIFKIPLYLEYFLLGQLNTDPIPDEREMYIYQGQPYFPRPDHPPHSKIVSIAWAGAYSENLATINLLFNLFNYSPPQDILKLARWSGVLPERIDRDYLKFLGKEGITFTKKTLFCSIVEESAGEIIRDQGFNLSPDEIYALRNMRCSPVIARIRKQLLRKKRRSEEEQLRLRFTLYDYDWLIRKRDRIEKLLKEGSYEALKITDDNGKISICTENFAPCRGERIYSLSPSELENYWVEGVIPLQLLNELENDAEEKFNSLLSAYSFYSPQLIVHLRDFKTYLALSVYEKLMNMMGVVSPLKKVPSLPLGSSGVTLPELSLVYTTLSQGFRYYTSDQPYGLTLIDHIDYNGETIYRSEIEIQQLIPRRYISMVDSVLEKVFQIGTARSMREKFVIDYNGRKYYLPVMGKTGTTNNFTNSSFVGIVPVITRDGVTLSPDGAFVVAGYVGYDDNKPMRKHGYRVFGSNGALPVVAEVMREIVDKSHFQDILSFDEIRGNYVSLEVPDDFQWYEVDEVTGIPLAPVTDPEEVDVRKRIETTMRREKLWLPEK